MAINKPRIAGQPAVERQNALDQRFTPRPVGPTESYLNTDEQGIPVEELAVSPEREGQMAFTISTDDSGLNRQCTIYVVVDISGTLTWKQVTPVPSIINQYTGRPYDPIYD